ncbi:hypothetical protein CNMCM7691_000246 [Aspergillus felis]|uniref:Uncharacterized protein n=1 Tax=Aspergillus felis TaxID=1287682 RepID=A0A8H6R006_9EURO|nr:hypothetical protein CNMCM7691_000246 [Aspergillus felis]
MASLYEPICHVKSGFVFIQADLQSGIDLEVKDTEILPRRIPTSHVWRPYVEAGNCTKASQQKLESSEIGKPGHFIARSQLTFQEELQRCDNTLWLRMMATRPDPNDISASLGRASGHYHDDLLGYPCGQILRTGPYRGMGTSKKR